MSGADVGTSRRGAVLGIAFERPAKRNALTAAMYAALAEALAAAEADEGVRAVLFHGDAEVFTAGNDLGDFIERPPQGEEAPVWRFLRTVVAARKPLVAAVNGPAIGLGTTLLLHCDLVLAGDNARFQLPFVRLGLVPEFASSYLLPLRVGAARAAEWLMLGEPFDAHTALDAGLVARVLPAAATIEAAWEAAAKLAALPASAVRATKALLRAPHRAAIEAQLAAEAERFRHLLVEPAAREAFAAFLAKRKPDFGGM